LKKKVFFSQNSAFPADFIWYWETKAAIDRQERIEKEAKEIEEKEKQKEKAKNEKPKKKEKKKKNKTKPK
jgi:hypothetical protein